jgi:hypothetical protein
MMLSPPLLTRADLGQLRLPKWFNDSRMEERKRPGLPKGNVLVAMT